MTTELKNIIGSKDFITQKNWLSGKMVMKDFEVVRDYSLISFNNFQEVISEINNALKNLWGEKFDGYEHAGSGVSQVGDAFILGDVNFVTLVITPALQKYKKERNAQGEELWYSILTEPVSQNHPSFLKRAMIPLLINDLISQDLDAKGIAAHYLQKLIKRDRGIPRIADLVFENVCKQKELVPEDFQLQLLIENKKSFEDLNFSYFDTVFAYELLFRLCASVNADIARAAIQLAREWLEKFRQELMTMEVSNNISYKLYPLLKNRETQDLLIEFFRAYSYFGDELVHQYDYQDPTQNLYKILAHLFAQHRSIADSLVSELLSDQHSSTYANKLLSLAITEVIRIGGSISLSRELTKAYAQALSDDGDNVPAIELADKLIDLGDAAGKEEAYHICMDILEKGLSDPSLPSRYELNDKEIRTEKSDVFIIIPPEGKAVYLIKNLIKEHPDSVYQICLRYWHECPSLYLKKMAGISLSFAISHIINLNKERAVRDSAARKIFEEFAGKNDLELVKKQPYEAVGIWDMINHTFSYLSAVIKYEEIKTFQKLGEGKEDMYWVLFYYANNHKKNENYQWKDEQYEEFREDLKNFLISGSTEELRSLLNDFRNNVRQKNAGTAVIDAMKMVLQKRIKGQDIGNDLSILDMLSLVFIEAAEAKDERFIELVPVLYTEWLLPVASHINPNGPFVYIPPTQEVLRWYAESQPKSSKDLIQLLVSKLHKDWQHRMLGDVLVKLSS